MAFAVMVASNTAIAQVGWLNPEGKPGIGLEWSLASLKSYNDYYYKMSYPFPTGALFLSARARVGNGAHFVLEAPVFLTKFEFSSPYASASESRQGIANPYIGIEFGTPGNSAIGTFGVRFPLVSEDNSSWALPAVAYESHRLLAFMHDVTQVSAGGGYRYVSRTGSGFRIIGGGQLAIPSEGDAELFGDLATNFWLQADKVRLMATFGGLVLITESGYDFGDRILLNLGLAADLTLGSWQPGIHFRMPLDDNVNKVMNSVYGIHVTYLFPSSKH
ncbi:MAG: hypothetical protein HY851_00155 [candidate division Zixibacteria bacterium]|nr:hypothetical protein [candidate division Zixibacteria bacterium]